MKKMNMVLVLVLCLCLVLCLTACAGGDTSTTTTAAFADAPDTTAGTESSVYSGDDAYDPGMDGYFDDYGMENNNIEEDEEFTEEIPDEIIFDDPIIDDESEMIEEPVEAPVDDTAA